ncbi:Hypothetical protein D9617_3g019740 [Elsinoe fawcettii]|nr:Hypothetical protein D9617_3g019740 [Elsinoe fawcettii]
MVVTDHSSLPSTTLPTKRPKHVTSNANTALRITQLLGILKLRVKASRESLTPSDPDRHFLDSFWEDTSTLYEDPIFRSGSAPSFGLPELRSENLWSPPTPPADMHFSEQSSLDSSSSSPCRAGTGLAAMIDNQGGDHALLQKSKEFMHEHTPWDADYTAVVQASIERLLRLVHSATEHLSLIDALGVSADQAKEASMPDLNDLLFALCFDLEAFYHAMNKKISYKHVQDCQRDEALHKQDWFSILFHARHPFSTTWPWCIKPSLVVLWGVCWMFYGPWQSGQNSENNAFSDLDQQHTNPFGVDDDLFTSMNQEQQVQQVVGSAALPATHRLGQQNQAAGIPAPPRSEHDAFRSDAPDLHHVQASRTGPPNTNGPRTPFAEGGLTAGTDYQGPYYGQSESNLSPQYTFNQDASASESLYSDFPHIATGVTPYDSIWQGQAQSSHLPQTHHYLRPVPSVTALNTSSTRPPRPGDLLRTAPATTQASNFSNFATAARNLLPPHLMNPGNTMQSPDSMARSREASTALSTGRPRAASEASTSAYSRPSPRQIVVSTPESRTDEYETVNASRTPERPEPRKNSHGQFICDQEECAGLFFDRKCEWTKHYDKHDRPYRCRNPACSKLQGFTYSGGLLRHEREVHHMHGGPKESLYCRFPGDCKRKSEKGFTRKENRDEHERRVHNGPFDNVSKQEPTSPLMSETSEIRRLSSVTGKRKASEVSETDIEDLRVEIKRLKEANEELRSEVQDLRDRQRMQPLQQQQSASRPNDQYPAWRPANR